MNGPANPAFADDGGVAGLLVRSPAAFAVLCGPGHVLEAANPAFLSVIGHGEDAIGRPLAQVLPERIGQWFTDLLDQVFTSGEPRRVSDARVLFGRGPGAREAFFDFAYEPRRAADGTVAGVIVHAVETTGAHRAQRLAAEQRALLEQIARDVPLAETLEGMAKVIEELSTGVLASVLLADPDGAHLRHGAGPSLPEFYNQAIDGIATGEGVGSCGTAAHRRAQVIVTDIGTDPFWDDFRDLADRAGLAACWSTPIMGAAGELLGTFAMYHRTPRAPAEADLALAGAFVRTAALAIEREHIRTARAQAEAKERAARSDLAFILETSTAIGRDLDYTAALERLARSSVPRLAPMCVIDATVNGELRRIAACAGEPGRERLLSERTSASREHGPVTRVLASGVAETGCGAPTRGGSWDELEVEGYACVPLTARGVTFGVMTLLTTAERPFDEHTLALARDLAGRAAASADNARQYTDRVALARDLQAGLLLDDPPAIPGFTIATHYLPAGEGLEIGGDFYDVFPLGRRRWAFLIGDVCGKGPLAATTTALVRHTVRTAARLLEDPVAVAEAVNSALLERSTHQGDGFVTLVYGHLAIDEHGQATVELVRAGHVEPLVRRADGRVETLKPHGMILGFSNDPHLSAHSAQLEAGAGLLLVTDGLTEARGADRELFGPARLAEALANAPAARTRDADQLLAHIIGAVEAFGQTPASARARPAEDDHAALLILHTG